MTVCVSDSSAPTAEKSFRILRWVFRRQHAVVVCELRLTVDDRAYALHIEPPWNPTGLTTEVFYDAMSAFRRHLAIEQMLVKEGWSLDNFESRRASRLKDAPSQRTESPIDG